MKKSMTSFFSVLTGVVIGVLGMGKRMNTRIEQNREMSDKHFSLFLMMNKWVKIKQEGKNLASYFEKNGYREIAIYGMSYAGETLVEELQDSDIKIKYGIDKRTEMGHVEFEVVSPDERLEDVDAVVVTAIKFFNEIEEQLSSKLKCPIISLEDVLFEL